MVLVVGVRGDSFNIALIWIEFDPTYDKSALV